MHINRRGVHLVWIDRVRWMASEFPPLLQKIANYSNELPIKLQCWTLLLQLCVLLYFMSKYSSKKSLQNLSKYKIMMVRDRDFLPNNESIFNLKKTGFIWLWCAVKLRQWRGNVHRLWKWTCLCTWPPGPREMDHRWSTGWTVPVLSQTGRTPWTARCSLSGWHTDKHTYTQTTQGTDDRRGKRHSLWKVYR